MTPFEKSDSATRMLEEPVIKQAFIDIREGLVRQLENVPIGDTETQHQVSITLQLLKRLEITLHRYIQDQKVIDFKKLQEEKTQRRRESLATR